MAVDGGELHGGLYVGAILLGVLIQGLLAHCVNELEDWRSGTDRYDSPRDARARAKGMPGPYITGGDDPDIGSALVEERRLSRWLVIMVVTIIGSGFVIGTILALVGPTVTR